MHSADPYPLVYEPKICELCGKQFLRLKGTSIRDCPKHKQPATRTEPNDAERARREAERVLSIAAGQGGSKTVQ